MSNKANPAAIGAFVVGAVALAVVAVLVLGSGKLFRHTTRAVCFFTGDVMGLNVGAPVKFKGVDVGSVAEVRLRISEETGVPNADTVKRGVRMPVIIEIDNDKVTQEGATRTLDRGRLKQLIDVGLRAQLVSQSLVTGLLLVKLDFNPDVPPVYVLPPDSNLIEIPTMPTSMQQIQAAAQDVVRRLEQIDIERLVAAATGALEGVQRLAASPALQTTVDDLPSVVASAKTTLASLNELLVRVDREQGPLLQSVEHRPELGFVCFHPVLSPICDRMTPRAVRPSTRTESLSVGRTWRTNSVSCTTGCRLSQSQSIPKGRPYCTMK